VLFRSQVVYVSPEMRAAQLNRAAGATSGQADVTYANAATASNGYPEDVTVVRPAQVGTPGYGVYVPETVENYDYSQNVVSANSPVVDGMEPSETRAIENSFAVQPTANYVVGSGDTVYNIARRLCVNVEDVQQSNALGSDFAIKIGQPLYLPQSQCAPH
jgi:LysM repeat protein